MPDSQDTGGSGENTDTTNTETSTGGSITDVWRPFNADSPWNTLIGDSPTLHIRSDEWIADFATSSPYGEHLDVNIENFSIPLYWADGDTPLHTVTCTIGGQGFDSIDGFNATVVMPIPSGAIPDPSFDAHMLVVDKVKNIEWGLYATENNSGNWSCELGATSDLTGSGVRPLKVEADPWYHAHGPRACGYPLSAGLITLEEIEAGSIDHALVFAYPHIRGGCYTSPASTAQVPLGEVLTTRGIPCGGRIQLDPQLDLDALGLDRTSKIIAKALQEYGAYVGDYSGAISIYGESSPAAIQAWNNVLDQSMIDKIPLDRFRVINHPNPVYADNNAGTGYVCE